MTNGARSVVLAFVAPALALSALTANAWSATDENSGDIWRRDDRAFVYQHEGRTRYPSITRTADGRMLALFTRQTQSQEEEQTGDLVLVPRSRDGQWWIRPRTVFTSDDGVPRAGGTMTTLADGRIIVPFVLLSQDQTASSLRILESADGGVTWTAGSLVEQRHLAWISPHGRPFELAGELVMPVFGASSTDDLKKTRHSCGLLRSSDGGTTWTGWSLIASGAAGDFSYEYPAVLPLGEGRMVAVLTARRLTHGTYAPQVLMRCFSDDGGRTWTKPRQLCVGSWPALAAVGNGTVVCAYSNWCPWGDMRLLVSDDGMETLRQDQVFVEHGWLPNLGGNPKKSIYTDKELVVEKGRSWWAYNPIQLPPVVPPRGGDWGCGHYGFPSVLALSGDRLVVALGNTQKGNVYLDPSSEHEIPLEHERIEAIGFDRIPTAPTPKIERVESRGRWKLSESWTPEKFSQVVLGGSGGYNEGGAVITEYNYPPLKSGRLIKIAYGREISDSHVHEFIGREKGYWLIRHERHFKNEDSRFLYSDDGGQQWLASPITDPAPMHYVFPSGQLIELDDGTLVVPWYGYKTEQDLRDHHYSSVVIRSHDGGRTWGDWSIIASDPDRTWSYCEPTLLARPDGVWINLMRTETPANQPWMGSMMCRSVSLDKGHTWSVPKPSVVGSQPATVLLPGGELAFVIRSTGRQASGVYFSRDLGETWDYALEGGYNTWMAGLLDENTFWVWANTEALIYRRVRE